MKILTIALWLTLAPTPAAVKATITRLYPKAMGVSYVREGTDYEAGFQLGGKTMSVVLTADGTVKETETTIRVAELPAAVRAYLAKNKPGQRVREAAEIVNASGVKTYEAEIGGRDLIFDATGKLVK